jgi:hypothetical protein
MANHIAFSSVKLVDIDDTDHTKLVSVVHASNYAVKFPKMAEAVRHKDPELSRFDSTDRQHIVGI